MAAGKLWRWQVSSECPDPATCAGVRHCSGGSTMAADCLEEAIAARIDDGRDIPSPSAPKRGELTVSVPPSMALKAAVYLAVREAGISNSEFARRMKLEKEARRILDPHHPTKLARIEAVLSVLGRHVRCASEEQRLTATWDQSQLACRANLGSAQSSMRGATFRSQYGRSPMCALRCEMKSCALAAWERPGMRTA